jgi:CubicO group peptidase (beta-lactamase class C family)
MKPSTSAITLRRLLTMTSGLPEDQDPRSIDLTKSRDWVGDILRIGAVDSPGVFAYSSSGSHLLSAILVQATGM